MGTLTTTSSLAKFRFETEVRREWCLDDDLSTAQSRPQMLKARDVRNQRSKDLREQIAARWSRLTPDRARMPVLLQVTVIDEIVDALDGQFDRREVQAWFDWVTSLHNYSAVKMRGGRFHSLDEIEALGG
jgi:hypothetical protein